MQCACIVLTTGTSAYTSPYPPLPLVINRKLAFIYIILKKNLVSKLIKTIIFFKKEKIIVEELCNLQKMLAEKFFTGLHKIQMHSHYV